MIEIEPVALDDELKRRLASIGTFDIVIFVSPNAVEHGMTLLKAVGARLPAGVIVAAVGRASARALASLGVVGVLFPAQRSNSEELLECDELTRVKGKRVVIFRAQDGRELLADTLRARGADVEYAGVYRRVASRVDALCVLSRWLDADCRVLVLTSGAAARVLLDRTPETLRQRLFGSPLAVFGERLRDTCREAGWRGPIGVCNAAGDDGLVDAMASLIRSHC
ncbi:MAG: uroporphyrinogen-III synthase [Proteobacteria bacterium]|nr:MAG: uroporphyrinogen-III synthase [Pseudomonadota bacterium]